MSVDPVKNYFEVAVTAPVNRPLTYLPPDECKHPIVQGMRVLVPLGARKITGYIVGCVDSAPAGQQIKKIYEVLDNEPLFPAEQISFYRWIANYYHYPIGEVIKTALPAGLTKKSGRRIMITDAGRKQLAAFSDRAITDTPWFSTLLHKGGLSPHAAASLWRSKERRLLELWQEKGWVTISGELVGGTAKAKTETCFALAENVDCPENLKSSEQKTIDALQKIVSATNRRFVPRREIIHEYPGAGRALRSLARKNIVIFEEQQVYRDPFGESFLQSDMPETLSGGQKKALDFILPAIKKGSSK